MRLNQDINPNVNVIRGYDDNGLRINGDTSITAMIIAPDGLRAEPGLHTLDDLTADHAAHVLEFDPELVLLGTGRRQVFPDPSLAARFLAAGIGFEVMDTGAACRTFNVLVNEQRRVVALLLL